MIWLPGPRLNISALIIENDREFATLLQAMLERWGVVVMRVASAEEAKLIVNAVRPEVILCGLSQIGADELAFIRWLRQSADVSLRKIPAIAMAADFRTIDARTARDAGFDVFLQKPIDPGQLPHIVALLVAQSGVITESAKPQGAG